MKIASKIGVVCAALFAAFQVEAVLTKTGTISSGTAVGTTLQNGTIYTVSGNVTKSAGAGGSALYVAGGATAALYIPSNVTLTVNGGAGSGRTPAGAGIYLPSNSKLIVFGGGKLVAKGGNAGNGSGGGRGGNASVNASTPWCAGGAGGTGGAGGGGAAAGVGGSGGWGGAATGGPGGASKNGRALLSGYDAPRGNGGGGGVSAGTLTVLGTVQFTASAGARGSGGGYSGDGSNADGRKFPYYYAAGRGGGGGGGGSGYAASYGFGGGAGGGGAGGPGGSGGVYVHISTRYYLYGSGGYGGNGGAGGATVPGPYGSANGYRGGSAGPGGYGGGAGGHGALYKASTASVNCGRGASVQEQDANITYAVSFDGCGAANAYTKNQTVSYTTTMSVRPPDVEVLPTRAGLIFGGYYSEKEGAGTQYVDETGKWLCDFTLTSDLALYAKWEADSATCMITFDKQGGSSGEAAPRAVTLGDKTLGGATTVPTYSGYRFCGYFTGENGTGTQVFDSNGAVIGMWTPMTASVSLYASWIEAADLTAAPGTSGTLANGGYYLAPNGTYAATSCKSGLYVAGNATTYLFIPSGTTFTLTGAAASGTTSAGAGICVPSTSTLVVFGGGTLKATGGKAANGSNGGAGASGQLSIQGDWQRGGKGGTGGAGGGGAGAGIGGYGGSGGAAKGGPDGPFQQPCAVDASCKDSSAGYTGNAGAAGGTAGVLYALGSVTITATGGVNGSGAKGGGYGSHANDAGSGWQNNYTSAPGGGGGGGGGGGWAYGIGGGGGGGGSGGSGGAGAITGRVLARGFQAPIGGGGAGGAGATAGAHGTPADRDFFTANGSQQNITVWSGSGGSGGAKGSTPGKGTVYVGGSASVNAGDQKSCTGHNGLVRTLTFYNCGATTAGTASQEVDYQTCVSEFIWKGADITIPTRTGCDFGGYYTEQFGIGTQHVGAGGMWTTGYSTVASRKLYAKWTANVTVNKQGDGTVTGSGTYLVGTTTTNTTTITAAPATGWTFAGWSDGSKELTRTVEVTGHAIYTAVFTCDYEDAKWKGYDPISGMAYETDAAAVEDGFVIRAGRIYYDSLSGAFTNAASGVTLDLLTNLVNQGEIAWGEAAVHPFDGHGYTIDFTCDGAALTLAAGKSLTVSNVVFNGVLNASAGSSFALDGATQIDRLNLGEGVKIEVLGDLTGSLVTYTAESSLITTNYAAQAEAETYFKYDGTAGAYVNDDGEIQVDWYHGTGTAEDPYQAIETILDESVTRLLKAAGKAEAKRAYIAIPTNGLVSADAVFTMPVGKKISLVLPDELEEGDNALFGPLTNGTDLAVFGLTGLQSGYLYNLSTNAAGVLVLKVTEFTGDADIPKDENTILENLTGDTGLNKGGDGTLGLQGENTYRGQTFVTGGKLVVEGPITESSVDVSNGAGIEIRGEGTLAKDLTIQNGSYIEVSEDVTLTNAVTLVDGAVLKYTGTFSVDEEQLEAFRADGTSMSRLSTDTANVSYEGNISLVFDAVFTNGTYVILSPVPEAVVVSKFTVDTVKSDATKNYALEKDASGNLLVTVTTKDLALSVDLVDQDGTPTTEPLTIEQDWVKNNLPSYKKPESSETKVGVELNAEAPNGMTYWQNYVLNTDPTNVETKAFTVAAPQTNDTESVIKLEATGINARTDAGVALGYRIDKVTADGETSVTGDVQVSSAFELPLDSIGPTGVIFKVNAVFADSKTKTKTSRYEISGGSTYGAIRISATNRFQAIAAPFLELTGAEDDAGISVSNLVRTATLTPGDKLHVYNGDGTYKVYVLDEDHVWQPQTVFVVKVALSAEPNEGTAADEQVAQRGVGAWIERTSDPTKPFTLFGKFSSGKPQVELKRAVNGKPGHNLLGDTGVEPFQLSRIKGMGAADQVIVPGDVPKVYSYDAERKEWGYFKTVTKEINVKGTIKTSFKAEWTTTENTIPAGTGYWLINKSGNNITIE